MKQYRQFLPLLPMLAIATLASAQNITGRVFVESKDYIKMFIKRFLKYNTKKCDTIFQLSHLCLPLPSGAQLS